MKETYHNEVSFGNGTASDYTCVVASVAAKYVIHEVFNLILEDVCVRVVVEIAPIEFVLAMLVGSRASADQNMPA